MIEDIGNALIGGGIIGLAASGMLISIGRITGISGILAGTLFPKKGDTVWRIVFLSGLMLGAFVFRIFWGFEFESIDNRSLIAVGIGGLLVGLGTNIGSGCTSGHGVCGISRMSPRSLVATITFMISGIITVFIIEHALGGL